MQLSIFQTLIWSVSQITRYIRDLFESDEHLQDLWVQGEISNLSKPASGHIYFTLKDNSASLRCVMWRTAVARQNYLPRDGEAVEVHGALSVYETSGQYQLYADALRPVGQGNLYQEFLRLKSKLETEGLFDQSRKRLIPRWPHLIGIITSPTGAAIRDILNTIKRRYPLVRVVLAPTQVQGNDAPAGIVAAVEDLNRLINPDVIILARGGGSIEDLWAFNSEMVARAIAASQSPVICGVGHETDFTIADFVSDLRAPTPTAAAELATPNRLDLLAEIANLTTRHHRTMMSFVSTKKSQNNRLENRLRSRSPIIHIRTKKQRVDDLEIRNILAINNDLRIKQTNLIGIEHRLNAINPVSVLRRGFALVTESNGDIISSVNQVQAGKQLIVQVSDGKFAVKVS